MPGPSASPTARCNEVVTLARHANVWGGSFGFDDSFLYYPVFDDDPSASVSLDPAKSHDHAIWRASLGGGGRDERVWVGRTGLFGAGLVVARGYVYVPGERGDLFPSAAQENVVWRVPVSGGAAELVAPFVSSCAPYGGIAADATHLYFAQYGCGSKVGLGYFGRVPLDGGPAATLWLDRDPQAFSTFVLGGSRAWFSVTGPGGGVHSMPADGSGPPKLIYESSRSLELAADKADVVIADDQNLHAVASDGSMRRTLASGIAMRGLVLLNDHVYGVSYTGSNTTAQSRIVRVPRGGGAVETVVPDSPRVADSLSVHGGNLYWSAGADHGGVAELHTMRPCP